jgi:glycosyltransferase involved in cell wall biosynthesis
MKVVHIVTLLELGGAQQTVLTLLQKLDPNRFEPVLFCGRGGYLDPVAKASGIRIRHVPGLVRPIRPWWDLLALGALFYYLKKERPSHVHTHSSKAGVLGRVAAWLAGVPVVVHTVHGFGFTPVQRPWVRSIFVRLERLLARVTSALVFVSKANRAESLKRGIGQPSQMHMIRAAVPLQSFFHLTHRRETLPGLALHPSEKVVTTVGPFKPQKNLADFVRAAALVVQRRPETRFLIVGDGQGRAALEKEIEIRGLRQVFLLPGWRQDMAAILDRTDLFCMTSLWEGLPMALIEAMASGLPSVVNAVDGCRDVIENGENGFLTPPWDPDATAQKLLLLLEDPILAQQMGKKARESIGREFDISTMLQEHERLYEVLFQTRQPVS